MSETYEKLKLDLIKKMDLKVNVPFPEDEQQRLNELSRLKNKNMIMMILLM